MPALVRDIILDQEPQADRSVVSHYTLNIQCVCGESIHNRHQDLVLCFPPAQQKSPWLVGIPVCRDPFVLCVLRTSV